MAQSIKSNLIQQCKTTAKLSPAVNTWRKKFNQAFKARLDLWNCCMIEIGLKSISISVLFIQITIDFKDDFKMISVIIAQMRLQ